MAKQSIGDGLNWRRIFALAGTIGAHVAVFYMMLMPTSPVTPDSKRAPVPTPSLVDLPPAVPPKPIQDLTPAPSNPVVIQPAARPRAAVAAIARPQSEPAQTDQVVVDAPSTPVMTIPTVVSSSAMSVSTVSIAARPAGYGTGLPSVPYPLRALQQRIGGTVLLNVHIGADGKVYEVKLAKSAHRLLASAAVRAVRRWTFEPATTNGIPSTSWVVVPIVFAAED